MCLLQIYPDQKENNTNLLNMSLLSACTCPRLAPDPLSKHSALISKTEFQADKHSKPRNCSWNMKNQKKNKKKADERPPRGRKHGHHHQNGDTDHQNGSENKGGSSTTNSPTTSPTPAFNDEDSSLVNGTDTVDNIGRWSDRLPQLSDLPAASSPNSKGVQVHFNEDHLTEVIEFPDDEDSKNGRKIYWEFFHIDRMRFRDRICQLQNVLDRILQSNHREQIYSQRFQEPITTTSSSSAITPSSTACASHSPATTILDCN